SCTGLHGANRLASNSLTECFVFGARAARAALDEPTADEQAAAAAERPQKPPALTDESREALWRYAGLERDGDGLRRLLDDPYPLVRLIAQSALARTESRGAHLRQDFPELSREFDYTHVTIGKERPATPDQWQ